MESNSLKEYIKNVKKVKESRKYKISNSYGVNDYYSYYKKNNKNYIDRTLYGKIIEKINEEIINTLLKYKQYTLPYRLGKLEIRKKPVVLKYHNGKLINNMVIDWNATLKLWYEDKDAEKKKKLIKIPAKEIFIIHYNKAKAIYKNKCYYDYFPNRAFKQKLKTIILEGDTEAFLLKK